MQIKIKKGDTVKVKVGKDKNKTGKVIRVVPEKRKIVIEGINMFKHHTRKRRQGEKGAIITKAMPLPLSRVMVICSKCGKPARVGQRYEGKTKFRICKKCGQEI